MNDVPCGEYIPSSPERVLLAAVLERAYGDLDYIRTKDLHDVRTAVAWFMEKNIGRISWWDVRDHLPLTVSRLKKTHRRLQEATQFLCALDSDPMLEVKFGGRYGYARKQKHSIVEEVYRSSRYVIGRS